MSLVQSAQTLLRRADVVAVEDTPYLGDPFDVAEIGLVHSNAAGQAAWKITTQAPEDLIVTTTTLWADSSSMNEQVGIDSQGNVVWMDLAAGQVWSSSRGMLFTDGTAAPGGGFFDFAASDQLQFRGNESFFWLTEFQAPLQEVLLQKDLNAGGFLRLLEAGQKLDGSTVGPLLRFATSPAGEHWVATSQFAGGQGIVVDGQVFFDPTPRGTTEYFYPDVAISDQGFLGLVSHLNNPPTGGSVGIAPFAAFTDGESVGGIPLTGLLPGNVSFSKSEQLVSAWFDPNADNQLLVLLCINSTMSQFDWVERVLVRGDRLDTDDDGLADSTVTNIVTAPGSAPEVSSDGELLVGVNLVFDADPTSARQAIVRLTVKGCDVFADGFESGDTLKWSATSS